VGSFYRNSERKGCFLCPFCPKYVLRTAVAMPSDKTDSICFQREKVSTTKTDLLSMEAAVL